MCAAPFRALNANGPEALFAGASMSSSRTSAQAALLLRTLRDLCIEKGIISADEMMAKAEQLDALDEVIDGRMSNPVDPDMPAD